MKDVHSIKRVMMMVGVLLFTHIGFAAADKVPDGRDLAASTEAASNIESVAKGLFKDGATTGGGWECFPYSYDWD